MLVPWPMDMDLAAQRTQPLIPAFVSKTSSAPGHKVRSTEGWKQPNGLARRELVMFTWSPSRSRESRARLIIGRPTKVTPRPTDAPFRRASNVQSPDKQARPRCRIKPACSAQLRFGIVASILDKAGRAKKNRQRKPLLLLSARQHLSRVNRSNPDFLDSASRANAQDVRWNPEEMRLQMS